MHVADNQLHVRETFGFDHDAVLLPRHCRVEDEVEARLPAAGQPASSDYTGEGYVIVLHPETAVVRDALRQIVEGIRVELMEAT